jgi:Uma2 family endonuclease
MSVQMTVHAPVPMSKEAFLAWIEKSEERCEYVGGRGIMMVRVTLRHALVTSNLVHTLKSRLSAEQHNVVSEAFAVHIGDNIRFPDVVVQPAQIDMDALRATAPTMIAEVLSAGTLHIDFGKKREEYLSLPTLQTYLVLSPDEPKIWIWYREDTGFDPEPEIVEGLDRTIVVPALGLEIPLAEVYRGIR